MRVEFTVRGKDANEVREKARRQLDAVGAGIEWRCMRLDLRPADENAADGLIEEWIGDVFAADEDCRDD